MRGQCRLITAIMTPLKKADTRKSEFPGKFQKSDQLVVHI